MSKAIQKIAALNTPSDLNPEGVAEISEELRKLLADVFGLYVKTKNFHWHMSGRHFRDYHLLLDEQADQLFAMTDDIAERARKIGGTTPAFYRRDRQVSASEGQQRRVRAAERDVDGTGLRQSEADQVPARDA